MPRTPLGPITPNIIRRRKLSPFTRGIIAGQRSTGASYRANIKGLNLLKSTIQDFISIINKETHGVLKSRFSKPKSTIVQDKRIIFRLARFDPKQIYIQLISTTGLSISYSTIYRILRDIRIINQIVKKRLCNDARSYMARSVVVDARLISNQAANGSWHPVALDRGQENKTILTSYRPK